MVQIVGGSLLVAIYAIVLAASVPKQPKESICTIYDVTYRDGEQNQSLSSTASIKYQYDAKGNRTEEFWYTEGALLLKWSWRYNIKGNRIEEVKSDRAGSLLWKYQWKIRLAGQTQGNASLRR